MKREIEKIKAIWRENFQCRLTVLTDGNSIVINGEFTFDQVGDRAWNLSIYNSTVDVTLCVNETFDKALQTLITTLVENTMIAKIDEINLKHDLDLEREIAYAHKQEIDGIRHIAHLM